MWDSLSEKVYAGSTEKLLKWAADISLAETRKSIRAWKKRLRLVWVVRMVAILIICCSDVGYI
jgi:hypothetical protein